MIEHGDCIELMRYLVDCSIPLIVTDPPYGMNFKSNKQNYDTRGNQSLYKPRPQYFGHIANDSQLPLDWLSEAYRVLKTGGAIYVFVHWTSYPLLVSAVVGSGLTIRNMIVLRKSNHGMGDLNGSYAPCHELLLFASKGRHLLRNPSGRLKDVWDVKVPYSGSIRPHPNYKPGHWITNAILNSSDEGDVVLDPFCGSGSFVKEAERLNRVGLGFEISKEWIYAANTVHVAKI